MSTLQGLATKMVAAFEGAERPNGDTFRRLRHDSPEWMTDVIFCAHDAAGQGLPDDRIYELVEAAVNYLHEGGDDEHDFADRAVDVYTAARLQWLASDLLRVDLCDEAVADGLVDGSDIVETIGTAQYLEALRVFESVSDSLAGSVV